MDSKDDTYIPSRKHTYSKSHHRRSTLNKQAPPPRVLIIQNDVLCPPLSAINSLVEHEIAYQVVYAFHELAFKLLHPKMYEAIIVLGGRHSVNDADKVKWLENEVNFIKLALKSKIPILGICLGAQLLAHCSGGQVMEGTKGVEIGYETWYYSDKVESEMDPFIRALKLKKFDKYIVMFHGDTFTLPKKCEQSGEKIHLLAATKRYSTLYRIGDYSYGFQGHPELNYDMLQIWCKSWGDSFLNKSQVNLKKDVLGYCRKNKHIVDQNSKILFDIWIDVALNKITPGLTRKDTDTFDQYAKDHWNVSASSKSGGSGKSPKSDTSKENEVFIKPSYCAFVSFSGFFG